MKNLYLLFAAVALAAFTGCAKDENLGNNNGGSTEGVEVIFRAITDPETRASITVGDSKFTGEWEDADVMGVFATSPDNTTPKLAPFTFSKSEGGFKGTLHSAAHGSWEYVAFYPHAQATAVNSVKIPFGRVREQNGNNYNSIYDVLYSDKVLCANSDPGMTPEGEEVIFKMTRSTSIIHLAMTTTELDASKKVKMVRLTADKDISAETLNIDLTDPSKAQLDAANASKSIVLSYKDGAEPAVTDCKAFFNVLPGTYASLKFDVQTTDGQVSTFTLTDKTFEAGKLYSSKNRQLSGWSKLALPAIEWVDHNMDGRYELNEALEVKVNMNVPSSITRFEIDIVSAALNGMGFSKLDLINPDEITVEIAAIAGLPFGDAVRYTTTQSFDMSSMMSLLMMLLQSDTENSNHDFVLTIGDAAGNTMTGALQLQNIVKATALYNGDADLWKNTATMTVVPKGAANVKLEYRVKGETNWNTATLGAADAAGNRIATIAPTWTESTNASAQTVYTVDSKTGVFAKNIYQYQLTADGSVTASGEFTPANNGGDIIPGGDMKDTKMACFTTDNSNASFWASGSFNFMKDYQLCKPATFDGKPVANLVPTTVMSVLAAGSLSIGTFKFASLKGTASFGQPYNYTARPTALKFKYNATVGLVDQPGNAHPNQIAKNSPDKSRIFFSIIDWSARHDVAAGVSSVSGGWDVESQTSVAEGNIIGYGALWITESTTEPGLVEAIIPIYYYDKVTKPSKEYTLCLSAATSAYGDYKNGSTNSSMYITDFEWVY